MFKQTVLSDVDSYKCGMYAQYPPETTNVYSYIESRGGRYPETVVFGLQTFIKEYLLEPFNRHDINEIGAEWDAHGEPFNWVGWRELLGAYGGHLPLMIKSVPEGTELPVHQVMTTIENTDERFPWLTSWLETSLLRAVWYPTTVATNSREIKKLIKSYMVSTGGDLANLNFKLHDFGARGVSSRESARLGGMGHLVSFMGTDTFEATKAVKHYYGMANSGFSVPAMEHSTVTSWGRENELHAYRNMLRQFGKPGKIVSMVGDSYDIYHMVSQFIGVDLKQEIIDSGAVVVVRPDSGVPEDVVLEVAQRLDAAFGHTLTLTGHKLLNHVRVLQGDGINYDSIDRILLNLKNNGFCADNMGTFGAGGVMLQMPMRDDQKFAMKCSSAVVDGEQRDVYKDPSTDHGKKSKRGRFSTIYDGSSFQTVPELTGINPSAFSDLLRPVFRNGDLLVDEKFEAIRARAELV